MLGDDNCPRERVSFYCWFDGQAAQLRFGVISGRERALPFQAPSILA